MPIYVHRNSQQLGPYTAAEVRSQLANGALSVHDHVWWQGQQGWVPLGETQVMASDFEEPPGPDRPAPAPITGTSQFAVAAMVAACLSLFLSIFTGVPAIIFGHLALGEIKKNPSLKGRGLAIAGFVIGCGTTLVAIVFVASFFLLSDEIERVVQVDQAREEASALKASSVPTNRLAGMSPSSAAESNSSPVGTNSSPATNSANPSATNAPNASSNSSSPATNAPDSGTNAAPMNL